MTRISNFWALAARCVIDKSWKNAEFLNFGPACFAGAVTKSGALGTHRVAA
jgi:hypothetical protein